jgi:hypothetical protein
VALLLISILTATATWKIRCSVRIGWRNQLFRGHPRTHDKLRDPFVSALHILPVHHLELIWRKGMRGGALHQRVGPRAEPRKFLDVSEILDPVEEEITLQKRRVSGINQ